MKKHFYLGFLAVAVLSACGGGGGDGGGASTMSETQRLFVENAIVSNGGSYLATQGWSTTGLSINLTSAQATKFELPQSPEGIAVGVVATITPGIQLISTLPTPADVIHTNPNVGTAFIDNGQIYFYASSAPSKYTFIGNDVMIETAAPGGQVGFMILVTSYEKVALSGTIGNAPVDLINFFRPMSAFTNPNATFLTGAAYYKRVSTMVGDHLSLRDADSNNTTNAQSATPVAIASTIEQFASAQPTQLTLNLGSIRTVKGARCWVNDVADRANVTGGAVSFSATTPSFGAYCEVAGNLYLARLQPNGAQNGQNYPTGLASPQIGRLVYQPRFNKAAYDSLKAALP
jgi:hypothetical protein